MPDAGAGPRRLDEHRQPEGGQTCARTASGSVRHWRSSDHLVRAHLEAGAEQRRPSCAPCPWPPRRRTPRSPRTGSRRARAGPGSCRPRPTDRAGPGRPRRCRAGAATAPRPGGRQPAVRGVTGQHDVRARRVDGRAAARRRSAAARARRASTTQRPSVRDPDGHHVVARRGRSRARTLPALMQEIACSLLRPPKTTATRIRPLLIHDPDPSAPRPVGCGGMADRDSPLRPTTSTPASRQPASPSPPGRPPATRAHR